MYSAVSGSFFDVSEKNIKNYYEVLIYLSLPFCFY
jgi:hypothetical protein